MKARGLILAIVIIVLIGTGLTAIAYSGRPELVSIYPSDREAGIPVTDPIKLEFSRPMNHEVVQSHLKIEPSETGTFRWEQNVLSFLPNALWPSGQELTIRLEPGARAASWLAFPMRAEQWSFSTSAAYLAYLWPSNGPADIYALNPVTGSILQYTKNMGVLEFSASQDGMWFYFSASNTQGGADVYKLDRKIVSSSSNGSYQPSKLLDCGQDQCRAPVVSTDAKYLAYEHLSADPQGKLGPAAVTLVTLEGLHPITMGTELDETVQPIWSSEGDLAYYDRTRQAYEVFHPPDKSLIELPNQTGQPGSWSQDGEFFLAPEIYYHPATGNSETGTSHLLRYNLSTNTWDDLSIANDVEDVEGSYSPRGTWIAFARKYLDEQNWSFGRQIWIMNVDGTNAHAITTEPDYNHYDFAWSRDGSMLAYVRFNQAKLSDPPELWMVNADGSNPLQLVIGGYSPLWIP